MTNTKSEADTSLQQRLQWWIVSLDSLDISDLLNLEILQCTLQVVNLHISWTKNDDDNIDNNDDDER